MVMRGNAASISSIYLYTHFYEYTSNPTLRTLSKDWVDKNVNKKLRMLKWVSRERMKVKLS